MGFTLRDPRMEAISGAGVGFGQGFGNSLGDQLVRYIEGRQLNKALEGVDANTPVLDVLKSFQTNRVSPTLQEQYLSQPVQGRLAQERAAQSFGEFANMSDEQFNNMSVPQIIAKVSQAFANVPGGAQTAGDLINSVLSRRRTSNLGNAFSRKGGETKPAQAKINPSPREDQANPQQDETFTIQDLLSGMQDRVFQSQGQSNQIPFAPFQNENFVSPVTPRTSAVSTSLPESRTEPPSAVNIRPMRATDVAGLISQIARENPDMSYEDVVNAVRIQSGANEAEFNAGIKLYDQKVKENEQKKLEDANIAEAVDAKINKDFPQGIDSYYKGMLEELTRYYPGSSINSRYTKAKQVVDRQINRLRSLAKAEARPLFGAYRPGAVKSHLDKIAGLARAAWRDKEIPNYMRPNQIDKIRETIASRGMEGPVEQEYIVNKTINPEFKKDIAKMDKLSEAPKAPETKQAYSRYGFGPPIVTQPTEKERADYQEKVREGIAKIADFVSENAGGYMSPLLVRSALLKKGWTDSQIKEAYDLAAENNANFSTYQDDQIVKLGTPQKPSLSSIFSGITGDRSEQDLWDVFISGRE